MTTQSAAALLNRVGVQEDPKYFGHFDTPRDRKALVPAQIIRAAWERHDADMFASVFSSNGSLLMAERQMTSPDEIREFMRAGFEGPFKDAHVVGYPIGVSHLNDEVSVVVTEGGITFRGEDGPAPQRRIRIVWVLHETDDGIALVSHQSTPLETNNDDKGEPHHD